MDTGYGLNSRQRHPAGRSRVTDGRSRVTDGRSRVTDGRSRVTDGRSRVTAGRCLLLALACALLLACGDDDGDKGKQAPSTRIDPAPYLGRYELSPSARGESLVLYSDGRVVYRDEYSEEQGRFDIDPLMLRIYLNRGTEPTGVFLLETFHRRGWRGFWNGNVRFLKK